MKSILAEHRARPPRSAGIAAAKSLGVEPTLAPIHGLADIEKAVAAAAAQPNSGVFVPLDVTISAVTEQTVATIARQRMPAIYSERAFVTSGGLVYYGADRIEMYRGAATYVDRILRGENLVARLGLSRTDPRCWR